MNDFEIQVKNVKPSQDWFAYRQQIKAVLRPYLEKGVPSACFRDKPEISNTKIQAVYFRIGESSYLWYDVLDDGACSGSQLEKVYSEYTSEVLYSSFKESGCVNAAIQKAIKMNKLIMIANEGY